MADRVVGLDGRPLKHEGPEPNAELVDRLERMLADAKTGRLQSFAVALLTDDGGYATAWGIRPDGNPTTLAGAVARLQARLCRRLEELSDGTTPEGGAVG